MAAADQFGLHEHAVTACQRPKLERYGDTLFVITSHAAAGSDGHRVSG
jgi:hypothetical protein